MDEQKVLFILKEARAIITNSHIVYASGKHGSIYINKDAIYPWTEKTSALCWEIASRFRNDHVDVVIAPAVGGVILSQWTAFHLTRLCSSYVLSTYADKVGEHDFVIKRGYDKLVTNSRVLVVEDVLTTGGSVKKVIGAVRAIGGNVVGLGVLCNRGGIIAQDIDVPKLDALVNITLDAWDEVDCPLCAQGVPINTDVGKGREFLARKK